MGALDIGLDQFAVLGDGAHSSQPLHAKNHLVLELLLFSLGVVVQLHLQVILRTKVTLSYLTYQLVLLHVGAK